MTPLVRQEHQLPIPVPQVLTMNAARPAKTVQQLVPADILYLIPVGATIQRQTNAETLVINPKPVVPIPVPAVQNTTPVLMPQRPNAVQPAITVQTVVQAVQNLTPVLMPQLLNAEQAVITAQALVLLDTRPQSPADVIPLLLMNVAAHATNQQAVPPPVPAQLPARTDILPLVQIVPVRHYILVMLAPIPALPDLYP